jgi:hypothetical protein
LGNSPFNVRKKEEKKIYTSTSICWAQLEEETIALGRRRRRRIPFGRISSQRVQRRLIKLQNSVNFGKNSKTNNFSPWLSFLKGAP